MVNLFFATNNACNLRCKYCYLPEHKKNGNKKSDELAIHGARDFIEKCKKEGVAFGMVTLHGAESGLLSPEAAAAVVNEFSRYNRHQYPIGIQSNGTLFSDEYFRRFESTADDEVKFSVGISIDGPAVINDQVRGKHTYRRAMAGLEAAKNRGYYPQILCVVGSNTVAALEDFETWMDELARTGQPIRLKPAFGAYQMNQSEQITFGQWLHKTGYARYYQETDTHICSTYGNNCFWLQVDVNGGCYSCNKSFGNNDPFANWKEESFEAILEKRRTLFSKTYTNPMCESCGIHSICHSGCPMDRNADGTAVDCQLKRTLISTASKQTGIPWREIVDVASKFQFDQRRGKIVPIRLLRGDTTELPI